ncbi:MAG: phosphoenolpyruvate synthase [Chloroflexi bacterium]|nr:phosphoenolpyruvate synthase [Chloroflexota bacterium]
MLPSGGWRSVKQHQERVSIDHRTAPWEDGREPLVVGLGALNRTSLPLAGGKAANLGELLAAGFPVPAGFCVTTAAYRLAAEAAGLSALLAAAQGWSAPELAARARAALEAVSLSEELAVAIARGYEALSTDGSPAAVAVRSSATAEDLPEASFAGQQDTYLNVVGREALLDAVRRCWASLWTDRAVAYREANAVNQGAVLLAVVVQRMVPARAAGVLFTANPLSGRRRQAVIDAAPGLGEAVVSGAVNPERFVVNVDEARIAERHPAGPPVLSDAQALELASVGAAVETHYGAPQDVEWAFGPDSALWLVQTRPITTLFPLPAGAVASPTRLSVYFSVNVAQGVLGPLTPAGAAGIRRIATGAGWLLGFGIDRERGPSFAVVAADRLFFDLTPVIRNRVGRRVLLALLSIAEARSGEAVRGVLGDPRLAPSPGSTPLATARLVARLLARTRVPGRVVQALRQPAATRAACHEAVTRLVQSETGEPTSPEAALERAERLLERTAPTALRILPVVATGIVCLNLARRLAAGAEAADEVLLATRGLPFNPTTEMNLELWALAASLRQDETSVVLLAATSPRALAARYLAGDLPRGIQAGVAAFLARYGFRGVAEIDLGVPRWRDDPTHVFGVLANYLRLEDPEQEPDVQFRRAAAQAEAAIERVVARTRRHGPLGPLRAVVLRFLLERTRALAGIRELPKIAFVRSLSRARELLLVVGATLASRGVLERADDVFLLDFGEARRALVGEEVRGAVAARQERYAREQRRRLIPRVLLSDGTALYGNEGVGPDDGLVGTPASPGVYTGPARVILDPAGARLEPGEVLVVPSTDPGWTPLFLTAGALVMEMGGMMSHGAVVAREYGIPAVVGALGATTSIKTGQRVTVDGSNGRVKGEE